LAFVTYASMGAWHATVAKGLNCFSIAERLTGAYFLLFIV